MLLLLATPAAAAESGLRVDHYQVELRVDPARRQVAGQADLRLRALRPTAGPSELVLAASDGLTIERVSTPAGAKLSFRREGPWLRIATAGQPVVRVSYRAAPGPGLTFDPDGSTVHTAFHTWSWLPSHPSPSERATLSLTLLIPAALDVHATGRPGDVAPADPGWRRHRFELATPYPAYTFGFAAGRLPLRCQPHPSGVELCLAAPPSEALRLERLFEGTSGMLDFYHQQSGLPFPHRRYTQVLLPGGVAQELAGLAFVGSTPMHRRLQDPTEDWLVAHELAHQVWGNLVTPAHWGELWLSEGLVTFLVAAYKERRWGAPAYRRELALAWARYQRAHAAGADRPLSRPAPPAGLPPAATAHGRAVDYSKGLLTLHALRRQLGDRAFLDGLRRFTRTGASRPGGVTSVDLRTALEASSGRDLGPFFARQVLSAGDPRALAP